MLYFGGVPRFFFRVLPRNISVEKYKTRFGPIEMFLAAQVLYFLSVKSILVNLAISHCEATRVTYSEM